MLESRAMKRATLCCSVLSAAFFAAAQEVPAPAAEAPASPSPAAAAPAPRPARRGLPPEAFTTPTNFVALVNVGGAVDPAWLETQAAEMRRSLQVGVKTVDCAAGPAGEPGTGDFRALARTLAAGHPDSKIFVILAEGEDLPPVLASPYEHWVVMDAGWVKKGGGDEAKVGERMGKRVYQALGACCGAAYRPERESVMRYSPTPESLDECLSRNFHPMNANAFSVVAGAVGLDPVRLRPRKELVEMGILKPRAAAAPQPPPAETGTQP